MTQLTSNSSSLQIHTSSFHLSKDTLQAHCSTVSSTLKSHDQPTLPNPSSSLLSSFPIGSNSLTNFSSSSSKSTILTLHLLSKSAPITFQPQTEFETSDFNSNFQPAELLSESQLFFSSSSTFTDCPNTSYVTMPASDSNTFPETTSTSLSPSSSPSNITPIHDSSSPTMTTTPSTSTFTPSPSTSTSPFNPPIPTITSTSVTNPLLSSPENSLPPHLLHYHQYYTEYYQSYYQSHLQSFSKYFSTVYSPTASTGATLSSASIMTSLPSLPSSSYTLLTSSSPSPPELSTPLPPPPPLSQQQPQNPNPLPDPLPQPHAAPPLPPAPPTPVRIRLSLRSLLSLAFKWSLVLYLFTRHLSWTKSIILCIFALVSFGFQAGWWFHRRPSFLPSLNVPSVIQSLIPGTHPLDPATNAREHLQAAAARLDNNNGRNEMVEFEQ
ncbi:hypothetical protein HMI54_001773 [Coelomomyces lativittatus]|nr:hypothetical protein HMI54_001773 [Coelomomyces lativittatus]